MPGDTLIEWAYDAAGRLIDGRLRIELEGRDPVELASGMAFSVPRGMLHRPVALEPTQVLMMEKAGVAVTGD
jgi:hypothetical protein